MKKFKVEVVLIKTEEKIVELVFPSLWKNILKQIKQDLRIIDLVLDDFPVLRYILVTSRERPESPWSLEDSSSLQLSIFKFDFRIKVNSDAILRHYPCHIREVSPPRLQIYQVWRDCASILSGIYKTFSYESNLSYHGLDPRRVHRFHEHVMGLQ